MLARLSVLSASFMIWAGSVLAAPGNGNGNGYGLDNGNGNGHGFGNGGAPRDVPEIDLFSGTAALMILATLALLLWERRRRSAR